MGMMVLDEFFLEQEPNCLDSQSFTNENIWVANWVSRLLLLAKEDPTDKLKIVFADRSPYTACVYAKKGRLLLRQVIDQYITELSEKNIFIFTIYLKVDRKVLWDRIQNRLKTE